MDSDRLSGALDAALRTLGGAVSLWEPQYVDASTLTGFRCVLAHGVGPDVVDDVVTPGGLSGSGVPFAGLLAGLTAPQPIDVDGGGRSSPRVEPVDGMVVVVVAEDPWPRDDLRRAEDLQRFMRAKLDAMFDPQMFLHPVRDDDGTLVDLLVGDANTVVAEYLGLDRDSVIGSTLLSLRPGLPREFLDICSAALDGQEKRLFEEFRIDVEPEEGRGGWYDLTLLPLDGDLVLIWRNVTDRRVQTDALLESERRYRAIAMTATDVVATVAAGPQGPVATWWSPSIEALLGWTPEEAVGWGPQDVVHPDDLVASLGHLRVVLEDGHGDPFGVRLRTKAGGFVQTLAEMRPLSEPFSGADFVLTFRDVDALSASETQYRLVAENVSDIVCLVGDAADIVWWSPSVTSILGWDPLESVGMTAAELVHPDDLTAALTTFERAIRGESVDPVRLRVARADGGHQWIEASARKVEDPRLAAAAIGTLRDIGARVQAEQSLMISERVDRLTGLANRIVAQERIEDRISADSPVISAVACLDLNDVGWINSAHGYHFGDLVIRAVAERLIEACGPDMVARIAGDEFLVMFDGTESLRQAAAMLERVMAAIRAPLDIQGTRLTVTASVGVAMVEGTDSGEILDEATAAMRRAAAAGPDRWEFSDPEIAARAREGLIVRAALQDAIRAEQLVPFLMPVVRLDTEMVTGYEALVRWQHADGSISLPDQFLPVAESTGLSLAVDSAVFRGVLQLCRHLPTGIEIGVNASPQTLSEPGFAEWAAEEAKRVGVDLSIINIEVTETGLLSLEDSVIENLRRFHAYGCGVWLDDFGTGYSSLSHLRDLPVTGMKLDRSFARASVERWGRDFNLVEGLARMAKGLGLSTLAEGIERPSEAYALAAMGWELGQGYLFGKPAPSPYPTPDS